MQESQQHRSERPAGHRPPGQSWSNWIVPALPVLACCLGGATSKSTEGIVVALLGVLLLSKPPKVSLGWMTNTILIALGLCGAIAFLPAQWFFRPEWRTALTDDFGIPLNVDLTPQPWLTLGCLVSFVAGLSWLYYTATQELELRATRFQLRIFAGGMAFLATTCIAFYFANTAPPFWHNVRNFGPFPNRNQTGDLFGIAAVVALACGQDDLRHGRKRWVAWLIAFAISIAAIILNFSRAGVLIVIAGTALWIGAVALRTRKGAAGPLALSFSVLLLLLTALLVFGGETFERFHLRTPGAPGMSSDFRWLIFQDAWHMIRASPWCGVGLGNFEPIFAIFREASFGDTRAHHPESDWIWLWAELGWPAVLLVVIGFFMIVRHVLPLKEGTNQRLRLAALIGAVLFALHGTVDVSAHRVGTAYAAILLFGLSLHRPLCLPVSRWAAGIFRLIGLVLLIAGGTWSLGARYDWLVPGAIGADHAKQQAIVANRGRNFSETISLATRALTWAPLDWQLYFLRALGEVQAKQPVSAALDDFRRARFLEPNAYEVPLEEGNVWSKLNPPLALTAWREALHRAGPRREGLYSNLLSQNVRDAALNRALEQFSNGDPALTVAFLDGAYAERFEAALDRLLALDPNLQKLTREQMKTLFLRWPERGDLSRLARAVEAHPAWASYAWEGLVKFHIGKKDFRSAFELARKFGDKPALPQDRDELSIEELRKEYFASPNNFSTGYAFYRGQMRLGKFDDALVTARHFTDRSDAPLYFRFLEAEAWAAEEDWERAWKAWSAYQEAARKR
jgi:O-antigen ligase